MCRGKRVRGEGERSSGNVFVIPHYSPNPSGAMASHMFFPIFFSPVGFSKKSYLKNDHKISAYFIHFRQQPVPDPIILFIPTDRIILRPLWPPVPGGQSGTGRAGSPSTAPSSRMRPSPGGAGSTPPGPRRHAGGKVMVT